MTMDYDEQKYKGWTIASWRANDGSHQIGLTNPKGKFIVRLDEDTKENGIRHAKILIDYHIRKTSSRYLK